MNDLIFALGEVVKNHSEDKNNDKVMHSLRVMHCMPTDDVNSQVSALLHEEVTNGNLTLKKVESYFNEEIFEIIALLSTDESEPEERYIERVEKSKNYKARDILLMDMLDESNNNRAGKSMKQMKAELKMLNFARKTMR